jgi:hypothetical protein
VPSSQIDQVFGMAYYNIKLEISIYPCIPDSFFHKPAPSQSRRKEPTNLDQFAYWTKFA